jgi:CHAT domain
LAIGRCWSVQLDGALHAVSLVGGRPRVRRLGPITDVDDLLDRVGFALRRLIRGDADADSTNAALAVLRHATERIDGLLLAPLPEIQDRSLVIVPTGPLQRLPWSVLPSCAGRPITVSPSATLWQAASSRPRESAGHVVVAAGPTLPGAFAEAQAVAAVYRTTPLLHPATTVQALKRALDGASVAHLATHGRLSQHNPLFSDLLLSDGPLFTYDLERLDRAPHTVVLAACDSARAVVYAGDEVLGLSATFLIQGTTQLVASILPVLDVEIAPLMTAFHQLLVAGLPPAVALATTQQQVVADQATMAAAAGIVCLGAGFTSPPLPAGAGSTSRDDELRNPWRARGYDAEPTNPLADGPSRHQPSTGSAQDGARNRRTRRLSSPASTRRERVRIRRQRPGDSHVGKIRLRNGSCRARPDRGCSRLSAPRPSHPEQVSVRAHSAALGARWHRGAFRRLHGVDWVWRQNVLRG